MDMNKQDIQNIQNQNTTDVSEPHKRATSIRKLYLNKRADVLRETFVKKRNQIESFVKDVESSQFNATKDELLFARSLCWMHDNLHAEASVGELSQVLGVSVRKIQRLFSFFLKTTYTNVLLEMRIEAAKGYLAQHKNSVGEVAYLIGVKDHAYFTYLFRKQTGMTPSEYRLSLLQES